MKTEKILKASIIVIALAAGLFAQLKELQNDKEKIQKTELVNDVKVECKLITLK